ncbi:MAG: signal recognition particle-docking protein FtsY [Methylohalobius sp. ZOD2]|nr:signal recognition particle-docking protein FtsY [Methylothermaceae bacterium]
MYKKLTFIALLLILTVLASGIYVRATGAGLACPDVPTCYGDLWPPEKPSAQALQAHPGFLYDPVQAWTQMGHRLTAALLGIVLVALAVLAWIQPNRRTAVLGSGGLLGLYLLQGGLGAAVVKSGLMPTLVTAHLLVAVLMAALAWRLYVRLKSAEWRILETSSGLRRYAALAWWVALGQVVLGAWVGANFAALACPDFPTCRGEWWPVLDWHAIAFWEQWQGGLTAWTLPDAQARITIHWLHRVGAALAFVVLFGLGIGISSNAKVPHLSKTGILLNFLLLVEIALGLGVLRDIQPALTVAHGLVGVILLLTVGTVRFHLRYAPSLPEAVAPPTEEALRPPTVEAEVLPPPPKPETLYDRLKGQLGKTRRGLTGFLAGLPLAGKTLDDELVEEIETHLLMADVGVDATTEIIDRLTSKLERHQLQDNTEVMRALRDTLSEILEPCSRPLHIDPGANPFVILVVGVNGVGKTTTIGKLAQRFQRQGQRVMLAAGDTFRAAAVEQLQAWGARNQVPVVAQQTGADSASVVYDALEAAKARQIDVLIADTAGRLHTKSNLMEELAKIKRIMAKLDPAAPHEVLLVLDATTGQNALVQAEQFHRAVDLTGLALTKLDGTAKGGVIFALAKRFGIPIRFIGIGEGIDDLQDFDAQAFVDALFADQLQEEQAVTVH